MIKLRIASVDDAKAISEIYRYYVENTAISFEYTAPSEKEFAERIAHKSERYPFIVAVEDEKCVGYAYASQLRERKSYDWDAELSVYVDRGFLRKGIGKRLYGAIIELLTVQGFAILYSGITPPNPNSIALHESFGFKLIGTTYGIGYKNGAWHDVVWYEKRINYFDREAPREIIRFPELDEKVIENILSKY